MCSVTVPTLEASHEERSPASSSEVRARRPHLAEAVPASGDLNITVRRLSNNLCVLSLAGEMDLSNAAELTQALGANVGPGGLIIELSGLTFMDSSGINQLVRLSRTVKAVGGAIALAAPNSSLERLFELVSLGTVMPIVASLEAAIDQISQILASTELLPEHHAIASAGSNLATREV